MMQLNCQQCVQLALLIGLILLVSACTATPQQAVFDAKTVHAATLRTAVAYRELPACPPQPCHDPAVLAQIQKADRVADAALDAAENAVRSPGFGENVISSAVRTAQEALQALVVIVAATRTQP